MNCKRKSQKNKWWEDSLVTVRVRMEKLVERKRGDNICSIFYLNSSQISQLVWQAHSWVENSDWEIIALNTNLIKLLSFQEWDHVQIGSIDLIICYAKLEFLKEVHCRPRQWEYCQNDGKKSNVESNRIHNLWFES